jgi:hypothetical protein
VSAADLQQSLTCRWFIAVIKILDASRILECGTL